MLLSNGMSNTTKESQVFVEAARREPGLNPHLVVIDAARGGQEASDWAHTDTRFRKTQATPWDFQAERLRRANVTPSQVQVIWM